MSVWLVVANANGKIHPYHLNSKDLSSELYRSLYITEKGLMSAVSCLDSLGAENPRFWTKLRDRRESKEQE